MVNFNMKDTIGRGIRKVFTEQQKRFFPMPDYQIDDMVQKHETIDKVTATRLRKLHLVEGRYPKLFLSEYVAKTANNDELKTEL